MNDFYYLRLCQKNWYPLEEYIGKNGVIHSRDKRSALMQFNSREEAVAFAEQNAPLYPNRSIQLLHHIEGRPYSESRDPDID